MKKSIFLLVILKITTLTSMSNTTTNKLFLNTMRNTFPQEIWWHISTFLNANDKALGFILNILDINNKQALELIKKYIVLEKRDPLAFFSSLDIQRNYLEIARAWDTAKNMLAYMEENIYFNRFNDVQSQLKNEYDPLLISRMQLIDILAMDIEELRTKLEDIRYAIYTIERFEKIVRSTRRRQACSNFIPNLSYHTIVKICITAFVLITLLDTAIIGHDFNLIDNCLHQKRDECIKMAYINHLEDGRPDPTMLKNCITDEQFYLRCFNDCVNEHFHLHPFYKVAIVDACIFLVPLTIYFIKYLIKPAHNIEEDIEILIKQYKNGLIATKDVIEAELSTRY
jgi:hypothetical protein